MAGDPYWGNTVSLIHADDLTDPQASLIPLAMSANVLDFMEKGTIFSRLPAVAHSTGINGTIGCYTFASNPNYALTIRATETDLATGDFTVEFWARIDDRPTANDTYRSLFCSYSSANVNTSTIYLYLLRQSNQDRITFSLRGSTGTIALAPALGTWHHFAMTAKGTTGKLFVDGVLVSTITIAAVSPNLQIDAMLIGYQNSYRGGFNGVLRDFKFTRAIKYTANFTPMNPLPFALPYRDVKKARSITATGSAEQAYTADYKYGGGCMRFDGASYAETPVSTDFAFGTGDFTIEFWLKLSVALFAQNPYATVLATDWVIGRGGQDYKGLYFNSSYTIANEYDIGANAWVHCAVTRQNGTLRTFRDGAVITTTANYSTSLTAAAALRVGHSASIGAGSHLQGLIDDLRITKGVARYTAAFTPPTRAYDEGQAVVAGIVKNAAGTPVSRLVRAYSRVTGRQIGETMSDPVTGMFTISAAERCYCVCLDDDVSAGDALIHDRLDPV